MGVIEAGIISEFRRFVSFNRGMYGKALRRREALKNLESEGRYRI